MLQHGLRGLPEGAGSVDWRDFDGSLIEWKAALDPVAFRLGQGSFGQALQAALLCRDGPKTRVQVTPCLSRSQRRRPNIQSQLPF